MSTCGAAVGIFHRFAPIDSPSHMVIMENNEPDSSDSDDCQILYPTPPKAVLFNEPIAIAGKETPTQLMFEKHDHFRPALGQNITFDSCEIVGPRLILTCSSRRQEDLSDLVNKRIAEAQTFQKVLNLPQYKSCGFTPDMLSFDPKTLSTKTAEIYGGYAFIISNIDNH